MESDAEKIRKVVSAEVVRPVYLIEKVHQHWRKVGVLQRKVQARHNQKDKRDKDRALVVVRACVAPGGDGIDGCGTNIDTSQTKMCFKR